MTKINPLYYVAILLALLLIGMLLICQPQSDAQYVQPAPTSTPYEATSSPTPENDPTPAPTPEFVTYLPLIANYTYPWETFRRVGSSAVFEGFNGISGKVVVAGLQTLLIIGLYSDGTAQAEVWLCKWPDLEHPVWVIATLEAREYENEWIQVAIPWELGRESGDWIVVYGTGQYVGVMAAGEFVEPPWWLKQ